MRLQTNKDEIETLQAREYLVVKDNKLVQQTRFELSLPEQKAVAFICSLIKPITKDEKANNVPFQIEYEFKIRDYCKILGIDYDNGKNYASIKATLKGLSDRSMWVSFDENPNEEVLCRWLSKVRTNKKSGLVKVELDKDMVPYLFDLGQKFTQYQLYNILAMKSAFSVRIYELMKSYAFQNSKIFDLDELKHILMVEHVKSYKDFSLFRTKVLEKAQDEINSLTDIMIRFEPIKKGRKVVKIKFYIKVKKSLEHFISNQEVHLKLSHNE